MGAIYALIALGFVLIFKSTGLLNFAQGELCMVGAFVCYNFATLLHVPYLLSFLIAIGLGALLGTLIEVLFFRRMVGEPIYSTIIVTLGLASILTCLTGLMWGHDVYSLRAPFMDKTVAVGNMVFSHAALYTIGVSVLLFGLFILFFNRSPLGIALKGTAEDSDAAGLMGINVKRMHALAWTMGTIVAVVAGVFLAEQSFVQTSMRHTGSKAMSAAILGGMETLGGAIIGGFIVGIGVSAEIHCQTDDEDGIYERKMMLWRTDMCPKGHTDQHLPRIDQAASQKRRHDRLRAGERALSLFHDFQNSLFLILCRGGSYNGAEGVGGPALAADHFAHILLGDTQFQYQGLARK